MLKIRKNPQRSALILITATAVAACAAAPAPPEDDRTLPLRLALRHFEIVEPVDRIRDFRINGWYYVDRRHVIFRAGVSKYYLLSFRSPCHTIHTAETIGFSTTIGRVTRFDKVLVRDRAGFVEQCLITEIHKLNKTRPGEDKHKI